MAHASGRDVPVLDFGPRGHVDPGGWGDRVYILWPVWKYQVVAPSPETRVINVFQKAMLGLCRAGVRTATDAARDLELDPQLAAFIANELQERGLVDTRWAPTAEGLEILEAESYTAGELKTGFVFRDAFSGALWPRYVERLGYAAIEGSVPGDRSLLFGAKGDRFRVAPVEVLPSGEEPPPAPTAPQVVEAALSHRRAANRRLAVAHIDGGEGGPSAAPPELVRRVFVSREPPELVALVTFAYCPSTGGRPGEWFVADPFGLGAGPSIRAGVEARLAANARLRQRIERLVGSDLAKGADDLARFRDDARRAARERVVAALTADACSGSAYDHLVDMEFHRVQAEALGGRSDESENRYAALAARMALEGAFADLKRQFPLTGIWKLVAPYGQRADRALTERVYADIAGRLGLRLPTAFQRIPVGQLRSVCDYDDAWRLRPAAMAATLAASCREDHPMRGAALARPTLLEDVDFIADVAGDVVHHGPASAAATATGDQIAERTYGVIRALSRAPVDRAGLR